MRIRTVLATVMALLALALVSCQIGQEPENVAVTIEPSAVTLAPGASTAFEATVTGTSDPGVDWTVTGGTYDVHASGVEITYTAPATEGTYEVTATSTADPTESDTATVTVNAGSMVTVSISPGAVTLAPGDSQSFTVTVAGSTDTAVTWSASCGSIAGTGSTVVFTAPASEGACTVIATSVADPNESASAVVTVVEPTSVSVSLSPVAVTLAPGGTHDFTATVTGSTDATVTWLASCGSIAGAGSTVTYTAPASEGSCTVTATSTADPSEQAEAIVTIADAPSATVTVTPSAATVPPSESQQFTATVTGLADTSVTWDATCGTIAGTGTTVTYTAPVSEGTCTVTATSVADASESASAVVTVVEPTTVGVSLSPAAATLAPGDSQSFTVTVTGSTDTAVTWSASCGSIAGTGSTVIFTAPASEGACTVIATSVADPNESASAVVTVVEPTSVSVSLSPVAVTLAPGGTHDFAATVTGAADPSVTWDATCGSIAGTGTTVTYTAPVSEGTCTVTATSVADGSESASATVTVTPPEAVVVTVTPANATLRIGGTETFTSSVTGTSNTAVTWSATGGTFFGETAVVYTAPDVLGTYTLTATSDADPSESASATIHVVVHPDELWAIQYGTSEHDGAQGVAVDGDGNVYVVGASEGDLFGPPAGSLDGYLLKLDTDGSQLWSRTLGTAGAITGLSAVAAGPGGNTVVAGATTGSLAGAGSHAGGMDVLVAKYAANGDRLWIRQAGCSRDDDAYAVAIDPVGNLFVVGATHGDLGGPSTHKGSWDAFLMKLDENGNHVWTRQAGTSAADWGYGVATGAAGNVVMTGYSFANLFGPHQGEMDAFVLKMSGAGDFMWARQFGTSEWDSANGAAIDLAGNVIAVGTTRGSLPGPGLHQGGEDAWVAKLGPDGTPLWARQYGTPQDDRLHAVAVGWAGNIVAVGDTVGALAEPNPVNAWDALGVKVDADGVLTWTRQFGTGVWGGVESTIAWDVAIGPAGNLLVVGHTGGSLAAPHQGWNDAFVIKLAP